MSSESSKIPAEYMGRTLSPRERFQVSFFFENDSPVIFLQGATHPLPDLAKISTRVTRVRRNWITRLIELRDEELERRVFV